MRTFLDAVMCAGAAYVLRRYVEQSLRTISDRDKVSR